MFSIIPLTPANAAQMPQLIIDITQNGLPAPSTLEIGGIIRVTVSLSDFDGLANAVVSLHFNPRVMQVINPVTQDDFTESLIRGSDFFIRGNAFLPHNWGGDILNAAVHPFLNNRTGLIGIIIDCGDVPRDLVGRQTVYTVYMRAIGAGYSDIRLSRRADGPAPGGNPANWHHDPLIYPRSGQGDFTPQFIFPNISFSIPQFISPSVLLPKSEAQVFKTDGTLIMDMSQLQGGYEIFATLNRENVPDSAILILAVRNNGIFYAVTISNIDRTQYIRLPNDMRNTEIQVFVWESIGTMNPIFRPLILK